VKHGYLEAYEQIRAFGIPLVSGGIMDQPHLWLLEYEAIDQTVKLMELINNQPKQEK
jgi:hypothetical protein